MTIGPEPMTMTFRCGMLERLLWPGGRPSPGRLRSGPAWYTARDARFLGFLAFTRPAGRARVLPRRLGDESARGNLLDCASTWNGHAVFVRGTGFWPKTLAHRNG